MDSDVQTESYIKTFPIKSLNIWKINKLEKDVDNTKNTEGFYNIHQLDRINGKLYNVTRYKYSQQ
ncbi:hypothetical protein D6D85_10590 [Candidatus Methanodesulfokora washburnensis]|uniref:Uncharacterized protein n=1 Tax=Candidatus Methanodesulfokora washburnensis TaxID=2478471 RepID=A0A3R9R2H5_9CREN|nr:hypothetical protein D6D85_10590 [Candidatus Methanodesulfokores washburnensis]